jgi:hypothetical protein
MLFKKLLFSSATQQKAQEFGAFGGTSIDMTPIKMLSTESGQIIIVLKQYLLLFNANGQLINQRRVNSGNAEFFDAMMINGTTFAVGVINYTFASTYGAIGYLRFAIANSLSISQLDSYAYSAQIGWSSRSYYYVDSISSSLPVSNAKLFYQNSQEVYLANCEFNESIRLTKYNEDTDSVVWSRRINFAGFYSNFQARNIKNVNLTGLVVSGSQITVLGTYTYYENYWVDDGYTEYDNFNYGFYVTLNSSGSPTSSTLFSRAVSSGSLPWSTHITNCFFDSANDKIHITGFHKNVNNSIALLKFERPYVLDLPNVSTLINLPSRHRMSGGNYYLDRPFGIAYNTTNQQTYINGQKDTDYSFSGLNKQSLRKFPLYGTQGVGYVTKEINPVFFGSLLGKECIVSADGSSLLTATTWGTRLVLAGHNLEDLAFLEGQGTRTISGTEFDGMSDHGVDQYYYSALVRLLSDRIPDPSTIISVTSATSPYIGIYLVVVGSSSDIKSISP